MCGLAFPVSINTGDLTRRLRREQANPVLAATWGLAARAWGAGTRGGGFALRVADALPARVVTGITTVARKVVSTDVMPRYDGTLPGGGSGGQRIGHPEGEPASARPGSPGAGSQPPRGGQYGVGLLTPQAPREVAGVDRDRARQPAHPVDGAGVDARVLVVALQLVRGGRVPGGAQGDHVAAHRDPLARRERDVFGRASGLAEAALDAAIDLGLHGDRQLEAADVDDGRRSHDREHHAGAEQAVGVDEAFDLAHHLVQVTSVLALHVRRHHPARAVLGLEVAVLREDEIDHVGRERLVPGDRGSPARYDAFTADMLDL